VRLGGSSPDLQESRAARSPQAGTVTRSEFGLVVELNEEGGARSSETTYTLDIEAEATCHSERQYARDLTPQISGHHPPPNPEMSERMNDDQVSTNLQGMDDLDFTGWNSADWHGVFARHHTDDVLVDWKDQPVTHGIEEHIAAMKAYVESAGGTPPQITSHPIKFGSGEWTCVVGEFEGGGRMVTVARWSNGAIAEEYIWS